MQRVSFFLSNLMAGGAERVILHLSGAMARRGHPVDLVLVRKAGPLLAHVPPAVRIVELGTRSRSMVLPALLRLPQATRRMLLTVLLRERLPKVVRSLPLLVRYLQRERPAALVATLPDNVLVALWAGWLARGATRIIVREANTQSLNLEGTDHLFERMFPAFAQRWYPKAAAIVAVSDGVADDLVTVTGLPRRRMTTIYNPVDFARIEAGIAAGVDEPWFAPGEPPVVVAVGRLYPQKDYPTLLQAFALARRDRPMRLLILGEGPERQPMIERIAALGLSADVKLPGLVDNPYAYMARADLLVLSSLWEGFPNVLLEALACGCPVVSTDCRAGPRELLADGDFGTLVPVGDAAAMAHAMLATLDAPPPRQRLIERARQFALPAICEAYARLMLPPSCPPSRP